MVEKLKITALERDLKQKARQLRRDGLIPSVVYSKGNKTIPLLVNAHSFDLCYREAGGNTIIALDIEKLDGATEKRNALIHEVALDPVTDQVLHADFLQIRMDEKITAAVPLKFIGDSIAVIELGGSLLTHKGEVEVESLPADLPHEIEVDIAPLVDFEAVIHVSDLKMAENVTILDDQEEVVAYVEPPRSEEELAELEETPTEEEIPPSEYGEGEEGKEEGEGEETESREPTSEESEKEEPKK